MKLYKYVITVTTAYYHDIVAPNGEEAQERLMDRDITKEADGRKVLSSDTELQMVEEMDNEPIEVF